MEYGDKALKAAQERAEEQSAEAERVKELIVEHYRQVHQGNWGADDDLWAGIGLIADPDVVG